MNKSAENIAEFGCYGNNVGQNVISVFRFFSCLPMFTNCMKNEFLATNELGMAWWLG
jgi:hypothetical protein